MRARTREPSHDPPASPACAHINDKDLYLLVTVERDTRHSVHSRKLEQFSRKCLCRNPVAFSHPEVQTLD